MFNLTSNFIKKIKKTFFPFYRNSELRFVFKTLQQGFTNETKVAMFVGGCVRKYLSNQEIDDIDIATILTVDQIKTKFKDTKFNIIDSGLRHGTVTLISDKLKLEITTLREDIKTDGRHAEIKYTNNWQKDSERRDFTINAIYLDINGKIFDPQLGANDLIERNVKFIGDPQKRIEEDYLRILRFIRFSLEYESTIEQKTIEAVKLNLDGIIKISKERVLSELFKILGTKNFIKLNENKSLKDIFSLIFPELKNLERLGKIDEIIDKSDLNNELILSMLLVDETNNQEYFCHKYHVSNDLKESLNLLRKNYLDFQSNKKFFEKELRKNIYFYGKKHLLTLNVLYFLSFKKVKLQEYFKISKNIKKMVIPKLPFDGNFLKKNGMKEGTLIGKTLKMIEQEWLDNDFQISETRVVKIIEDHNN